MTTSFLTAPGDYIRGMPITYTLTSDNLIDCFTMRPIDDNIVENNETLILELTSGDANVIVDPILDMAAVTIIDNDS